jgi:putative glycosyltransferase
MDLSIVTTLYHTAPYLEEFYARSLAVAQELTRDFEIIFVNDGSPDESLHIALSLYEKDRRVKVVDLSRNFGHHKAIMAGLAHARGELVFLVDSDLEEEPELLEKFYAELKAQASDVVFGVQRKRKGHFFEQISGALYFKVFNLLSTHPIPTNHVTARLMRKEYVAALLQHQEREFVLSGLWVLAGFNQIPIKVTKHHHAPSSYSLVRKFSNLVNAITSFSSAPLVFIFYLGCFILLASSLAAIDLIMRKILFGTLLQGWASLIISIWLLGGLTIFCMGVIGIYLSKIFIEVKHRPYAIIKQVYEHQSAPTRVKENQPISTATRVHEI